MPPVRLCCVHRSKRTRAIAAAVSCRCAWLAAALCLLTMIMAPATAAAAAAAAPNAALGLLPAPPQPLQDASSQQQQQQPEELAIPRILHQSWRTAALPARFAPFVASWSRHHPKWRHVLWDDAANRALFVDTLAGRSNLASGSSNNSSSTTSSGAAPRLPALAAAGLLRVYDALPQAVMRADMARYAYMYLYGGVYADLDFECLRPLDELFAVPPAAAAAATAAAAADAQAPASTNASANVTKPPLLRRPPRLAVIALLSGDLGFAHNVPNAFLASAPRHPFWLSVLRDVRRAARAAEQAGWQGVEPEEVTGPVLLKAAAARWLGVDAAPGAKRGDKSAAAGRSWFGGGGWGRGDDNSSSDDGSGDPLAAVREAAEAADVAPVPLWPPLFAESTSSIKSSRADRSGAGGAGGISSRQRRWRLAVLPPGVVYPFDWHAAAQRGGGVSRAMMRHARAAERACSGWDNGDAFDRELCKALVLGREGHADGGGAAAAATPAFAITYWAHTWSPRPRAWHERLAATLSRPAAAAAVSCALVAVAVAASALVLSLPSVRRRRARWFGGGGRGGGGGASGSNGKV